MLFGITGLIGSGKSTAAEILKAEGMAVIDADKIGRQVVDNNPALLKKLVKKFGCEILTDKGNLKRKKLAEIAFATEKNRKLLNHTVHPYLLKELKVKYQQYLKSGKDIVIDAALLIEWKMEYFCDLVIMIHASQEDRMKRLKKRGIDIDDALARQKRQMSFSKYRKKSDILILNNGSEKDLKRKMLKAVSAYKKSR